MNNSLKKVLLVLMVGILLLSAIACNDNSVKINGTKYYSKSIKNFSALIPEDMDFFQGGVGSNEEHASCWIGVKKHATVDSTILLSQYYSVEEVKEKIENGMNQYSGKEFKFDGGYGYTGCYYYVNKESFPYYEAWLYSTLSDGTVLTVIISRSTEDAITSDEVKTIVESIKVKDVE